VIRIALILFLFGSSPLLLAAAALKSLALAGGAALCGIGLVLLFLFDSRGRVLEHYRALPLDAGTSAAFQRIWSASAPARMEADFFEYRSPVPEAMVWVRNPGSVTMLFSRGFLETVSEQGLRSMFAGLDRARVRGIFLENRRFAVRLRFQGWKGSMNSFRYWFVSFWLFPIERLLFIARI
jgi:hypothetical protein